MPDPRVPPSGRFELKNRDIVITSNEAWGEIWLSKHNYAYELSKANRVFFLNPQSRWTLSDLFSHRVAARRISPTLTVVDYRNALPAFGGFLFRLNNAIVTRRLKSFFESAGVTGFIFWGFDPNRLYAPRELGASFVLYHAVDPYRGRPLGEERLCRSADVILAVVEPIAASYRRYGKRVLVVPHAISSEEFTADGAPSEHPGVGSREFGLYLGGIDYRLNCGLLERLLREFPQIDFVFAGRQLLDTCDQKGRELFSQNRFPNLRYLGELKYKSLKSLIARAKFCLSINMNLVSRDGIVSSQKLLQYLALGKPVFRCAATPDGEEAEPIYMSGDDDAFVRLLRDFLTNGEDASLSARRVAFASRHTFESVFGRIEDFVNAPASDGPEGKAVP